MNAWLMAACLGIVCLAPSFGQNGGAAQVITMTGRVSVLRDTSSWALNQGDQVQPRQIIITGPDGYAEFQVADGSRFEIFPNSRVTFRDNPGDWKDLLEVLIGRIKVHIQKLGGRPNNNRVRTPTAVIAVRGTVFDVVVEEEESTVISVEEGQVAVQHRWIPAEKPKELNPGEWIRVVKNQPLANKSLDKGSALQRALRAAADAMYEVIYRSPRGGSGGSSPVPAGGAPGGRPADTGGRNGDETPPPPPPPPQ